MADAIDFLFKLPMARDADGRPIYADFTWWQNLLAVRDAATAAVTQVVADTVLGLTGFGLGGATLAGLDITTAGGGVLVTFSAEIVQLNSITVDITTEGVPARLSLTRDAVEIYGCQVCPLIWREFGVPLLANHETVSFQFYDQLVPAGDHTYLVSATTAVSADTMATGQARTLTAIELRR